MTILIALAATLRYDEDIMDFLPITADERHALDSLQAQQSASRIVLIIEGEDEYEREDALYTIEDRLLTINYQLSTFDFSDLSTFHFPLSTNNIPDSLLTREAIHAALLRDKAILSTPGGSALAPLIQQDPLGLIDLSTFNFRLSTNKSFAFISSPYGSTETKHNAALIDSLSAITNEVALNYPNLLIRWTGAPVIAVGNARRIKTDTLLCISLSAVLIILLLAYAFPRRRDWWLILLSVSVGWLTGMAVLHVVTPTVSAVVLGIGSVLIGIAVNYPLHLLVHQRYTTSVRQTLDEVLSPLIVGNITTVGAFMALIPMHATALRHLGIFAAAMLVGTILFCVFVLPHLMSAEPTPIREIKLPKWSNKWYMVHDKMVHAWIILALTVVCGVYVMVHGKWSNGTWFDSNLTHINYMTDEQRADMALFETFTNPQPKINNQQSTIINPQSLITLIREEAESVGFRPDAFEPFYDRLTTSNDLKQPQTTSIFNDLVSRLSAEFDYIGLVCSLIVFVVLFLTFAFQSTNTTQSSINRSIVNRQIVNGFSLALIAFLPMALSWVWILAIMQLCHLQFNIVNIILATFIFGQGDDYTIFIVEGLLYERRTGKQILPQYQQSILLSALIMLIGIGILVFAVHPAMHSLGAVTLIGMTIVLLMAVTIPPLCMRIIKRI